MLFIKSKLRSGFRRAGVYFSFDGKQVEAGELTEQQLLIIRQEPKLIVQELEQQTQPEHEGLEQELEIEELAEVIATLDQANESLWTKDGHPRANALLMKTTEAQRIAAWKLLKAQG